MVRLAATSALLWALAGPVSAFAQAEADSQLGRERLRADLFCAAFFAPKSAVNAQKVPLSGDLVRAAEGQPMRPGVWQIPEPVDMVVCDASFGADRCGTHRTISNRPSMCSTRAQ